MPLTGHVGVVATRLQQSRKRNDAIRKMGLVTGVLIIQNSVLTLIGHAGHVVVVTAHQHGPRGRTHNRGMKLREQHALGRQRIDVRCLDITAKNTEVRIAQVIRNNQEYVGPLIDDRVLNRCITSGGDNNRDQTREHNS